MLWGRLANKMSHYQNHTTATTADSGMVKIPISYWFDWTSQPQRQKWSYHPCSRQEQVLHPEAERTCELEPVRSNKMLATSLLPWHNTDFFESKPYNIGVRQSRVHDNNSGGIAKQLHCCTVTLTINTKCAWTLLRSGISIWSSFCFADRFAFPGRGFGNSWPGAANRWCLITQWLPLLALCFGD